MRSIPDFIDDTFSVKRWLTKSELTAFIFAWSIIIAVFACMVFFNPLVGYVVLFSIMGIILAVYFLVEYKHTKK